MCIVIENNVKYILVILNPTGESSIVIYTIRTFIYCFLGMHFALESYSDITDCEVDKILDQVPLLTEGLCYLYVSQWKCAVCSRYCMFLAYDKNFECYCWNWVQLLYIVVLSHIIINNLVDKRQKYVLSMCWYIWQCSFQFSSDNI